MHALPPQRGFTLIELLVAIIIVSILVTIAVPSYRRYVIRSYRTDAMLALTRIQAAQEKYFLQYNRYTDNLSAQPPAGLALPALSDSGFYAIDFIEPTSDIEFTARATPSNNSPQEQDTRCQTFTMDHNSIKRAVDGGGADTTAECWR